MKKLNFYINWKIFTPTKEGNELSVIVLGVNMCPRRILKG
jgi:hypothetical protein